MTKNKVLLIWPPFLTSNLLPLGIPFLSAYLKRKGVQDVEVLDLNIAYLKTMRPHWSLYMLFRKGCEVLKNRPALCAVRNWLSRKIDKVFEDMEAQEREFLPRSLKMILSFLDHDLWVSEKNKIHSLLKPALDREDLMLVGISANYPDQLFFALLIAREFKKKWGDKIQVVVGGSQITKNIDYLVKSANVYSFVDFFIVRDGEEPLLKLLMEFPKKNFSNIPNLYFKDTEKSGGYIYSGGCFWMDPNDFLVPDFSGFDRGVYQERLSVIATRGCPWGQCSFCSYTGAHDRKFSCGSAEKVIKVLKAMEERYGVSDFFFADNALPSGFMKSLAEKLIQNDMKISWTTNIILGKEFADFDFCRLLRKSGLTWVGFGLESISRRVLKLMHKYHQNTEPEEMKKIFSTIRQEGIDLGIYVFFGFPTETLDEAKQTLRFLLDNLRLFNFINVYPFFLEDFTLVFNEPEKFGITKIYAEDKERITARRLSYGFETKEGMSREEAFRFTQEAMVAIRRGNAASLNRK